MRIKILTSWTVFPRVLNWKGIEFVCDPACRDYDWLVVYDELPSRHQKELLACPPEHTILVTQEPPCIKIYSRVYTRQFQYVLTTHDRAILPHRHYRRGQGCIVWLNHRSVEENCACLDFPKDKTISAICTRKKFRYTTHYKRYKLLRYLEEHLPELAWYGWGFNSLPRKHDALDTYKYSLCVENHIQAHHWTEKFSDALLCGCLPFYAGNPAMEEFFPPESFIRIPVDNPPEALRIIRTAIAHNEYERRRPAIEEARRLIVNRYNLWQQVADLIAEHRAQPAGVQEAAPNQGTICSRRSLRRRPWNLPIYLFDNLRARLYMLLNKQA
ncbi:MAG: glycosyltransferase family 1 protein [Akkermansia sp.]|nr:glycosyltransferase family 1 protein [Akkermansia sp.]